jgi:glycine/D-amino acid oxidase-like deaminating enzyme
MAQSPENIVVVGGGIAGISTAWYLATHPQRPANSQITVVEGTKIAAGASGYSGGFLAKDWHGSATESKLLAALTASTS